MADDKKLTTRDADFSAWYNEVVLRAELADYSPVRGCMVIRPNGYGMWERMQRALDDMFKATGHRNAYFPLPFRAFSTERRIEGFAPGSPSSRTAAATRRPLIIRPSETISTRVRQVGAELPRSAAAHQPVGKRHRLEIRTRLFLHFRVLWQRVTRRTRRDEAEEGRRILGISRDFMEAIWPCR
jgi:prolyl-tRNA synthetase